MNPARELKKIASELEKLSDSLIPDLSQISWIEDQGHNADFHTFFKISGQWYDVYHDEGLITSADKTTEAKIRARYERLEKEGKLLSEGQKGSGKGGHLGGGERRLTIGTDEPVEKAIFILGDDPDMGSEITAKEIAEKVNNGTFEDALMNS